MQPRPPRARHAIALLALVTLLALTSGCSTSTDDDPAGQSTAPAAEPGTAARADRALQRAVAALSEEDLSAFKAEVSTQGTPLITVAGVATTGRWEAITRFFGPGTSTADDPSAIMLGRSVDDTTWIQLDTWSSPLKGCWLEFTDDTFPLGIFALQPGDLGYFALLPLIEATGFAEDSTDTVLGEVPLEDAVGLVTANEESTKTFTFDGPTDVVVPVTVTLDGDRIASLTMAGGPLLTALREADQPLSDQTAASLPEVTYAVTYPAEATPGAITAPEADLVVTEATAEQGC